MPIVVSLNYKCDMRLRCSRNDSKKNPHAISSLSLSFFRVIPCRSQRTVPADAKTCRGAGTRTRKGVLVSTIIRVSSRRMSFINARGKLRPYTCIYTRMGRKEIERERQRSDRGGRGDDEEGLRERVKRGVQGERGTRGKG